MKKRRNFNLFLKAVTCITEILLIKACSGAELSEAKAFSDVFYLRKLLSAAEPPNGIPSAEPSYESANAIDSYSDGKKGFQKSTNFVLLAVGALALLLFAVFAYFAKKNISRMAKEKELLKSLAQSPHQTPPPPPPPPPEPRDEAKSEERCSELVFFVDKKERFNMDDLLEATADLRSQGLCSSLYMVTLKDNAVYAVKRLKKLLVSFEEFNQTMTLVGNLKHPNILPLVAYNSTSDEKLLIYKYQTKGSLLNLLEDHMEGKSEFLWKLRLSIACGVARGLDFIYQNSNNQKTVIPHGNLKLSNILLDKNMEPLISEYGYMKFIDPKRYLFASNGYTAPEKTLSEQGDVFSFGIILLALLTGKTVEKSGIDLPKWVKSMVREEWTGEVFDREVNRAGREYAFPLLNISLKCVSHLPEDRPTMAEVMEKIEEVMNAHEDISISTYASIDSISQDWCLLHTVIPETWDTPGSNY